MSVNAISPSTIAAELTAAAREHWQAQRLVTRPDGSQTPDMVTASMAAALIATPQQAGVITRLAHETYDRRGHVRKVEAVARPQGARRIDLRA